MYHATIPYEKTNQAIDWCRNTFGYDEINITHTFTIKGSAKAGRWRFHGRLLSQEDSYLFNFENEIDRNWFLLKWQ